MTLIVCIAAESLSCESDRFVEAESPTSKGRSGRVEDASTRTSPVEGWREVRRQEVNRGVDPIPFNAYLPGDNRGRSIKYEPRPERKRIILASESLRTVTGACARGVGVTGRARAFAYVRQAVAAAAAAVAAKAVADCRRTFRYIAAGVTTGRLAIERR